ncbi:uncharacterized protein [Montipora foliosa]|uniref:uncharacterized protein n=1 Tax=Montipora foliosa TaxID=591990 RepID=UPI0035F1F7FF
MTSHKQSLPSFASIASVLSIVLYCAGFLRVEFELSEHKKRINAIESVVRGQPPTSGPNLHTTKNVPELELLRLRRRRGDSAQPCLSCPPGPPGPPGPKGEKGFQGRRGKTGRNGKKGDQGIMGSPGKSGKQGIMGLQGEAGPKGQKGEVGSPGKPGAKGEPGESISTPTVAVSPKKITVNESESASFQCSVTGNPEPTVAWSRMNNETEVSHSVVSGKMLRLRNVKGNDAGIYRCSATNILGKARAETQLEVNVQPCVFLHPGPLYISEGSNVTLPTCHVTGHPTPEVKWSKSFGQLPLGRVLRNNTFLRLSDVRKTDSGDYFCTAANLVGTVVRKTLLMVVSLPRFTFKPPTRTFARLGDSLKLNCSATGDPQPVISWKRQGSSLPAGRNQQINAVFVLRDLKKEDAGNYICAATSAGVFTIETGSYVEVRRPRDCTDLLKSGQTHSGVYSVDPDGKGSFNVYCDMSTDSGGWTVFQRRRDGSVDFYRRWNDYKSGFGQLTAEFWLGNDKIHRLTASRPSSLRVELEDWNGVKAYAKYGRFTIGDEQALYRLKVSSYSGTAGDSLAGHNNMAFSTKDRDNDSWGSSGHCAVSYTGAWWYNLCHDSNLNGKYLGEKIDNRGLRWKQFRGGLSLKFTEMKLRPLLQGIPIHPKDDELFSVRTMNSQKQSLPSFASIVSVLSILFYCAGFLRIEFELSDYKKRINAIESVVEVQPLTSRSNFIQTTKNVPEPELVRQRRRRADSPQSCLSCPPGPPGPPGSKGEKGSQGRRGKTGRNGKKGDQGIMGSPGKSGKQGIMGPQGEAGPKGQKGDVGLPGKPGTKGAPGESISDPTVAVSPAKMTVNESESASFKCSVTGNPEPTVVWSRMINQTEVSYSAVSGKMLRLRNVKGSDAGIYRCSATNILGKARAETQLEVNVQPFLFLHPGPLYISEGSNVTLPTCQVTGHPTPEVKWSKLLDKLPLGRVLRNNTVMKLEDVRKSDSAEYICTATNLLGTVLKKTLLLVVSLPRFLIKPPVKIVASLGYSLKLNCSATGDTQPVISWKRQGSSLPAGRNEQINGALVIRNVKKEDAGNYICVATSAGVSTIETLSYVEVRRPRDCSDLLNSGQTHSGVYSVDPDDKGSFNVYCDMRTDGGGWTVFQRRQDGSIDFHRGWNDYKSGFGQLTTEFWLGNDKIHRLTASRPSSLRVELEDWNGGKAYAKYGRFNIGNEQAQYRLEVSSYSGTAGDSLAWHNYMAFSTKDRDNDRYFFNCAVTYTGGWWYNNCHHSNLNGRYVGEKRDRKGTLWVQFRDILSLKFTEMKLRP